MDEFDLGVRNATYGTFVALGRAPSVREVADEYHVAVDDVRESWGRLHDAHALVLQPDRTTLLMANPFSAVPTRFKVLAGGRSWFANCSWDAFGICAALHTDGHISTACADCDEAIEIDVRDKAPSDTSLLFHSLVPAPRWWDDIAFT